MAYAGGWKKFEPAWHAVIRAGQVLHALPLLEAVLGGFGERAADRGAARDVTRDVTGAVSQGGEGGANPVAAPLVPVEIQRHGS
ncbi:hypothetical protein [Plantactinospora veratri]